MRTATFIFLFLAFPSHFYSQENYFPLQIGDYVTYERTANNNTVHMKHTVIDVSYNNGRKHYHILREISNITTGTSPDTSYIYYQYNPCDNFFSWSSDIPSLFQIPIATENPVGINIINSQYQGQDQTLLIEYLGEVTVPAGTFQDCYKVEGWFGINPLPFPQTRLILAPNIGAISYGLGAGLNYPINFDLINYAISPPEPVEESPILVNIDHYHHSNNPNFDEPTMISKSIDDEYFSVCADSSFASSFTITSNLNELGDPYLNLTQAGIRIVDPADDEQSQNILGEIFIIDQTIDKIQAYYLHPNFMSDNIGIYHTISLEVYNPADICEIYQSIPIRIYRPPLLLVHGLFGNKYSMEGLKDYLTEQNNYQDWLIKVVDYSETNDQHFNTNINIIPENIDRLIDELLWDKISAGKVNIIAHSMGGILSRLYLQNENYRNDINKLITLNTPHSGSQIANLLLDENIDNEIREDVCDALWILHGRCNGGAIDDLRINSHAILNELNGIESLNRSITNTHVVGTIATPNYLLKYILGENVLNELFNNELNDMIVALNSQTGGIVDISGISLFDHIHMESFNDSDVKQAIGDLLEIQSSSVFFVKNGYSPVTLQYETPTTLVNSSSERLTTEIISPAEGQVYNYGDNLSVNIQSDNTTEEILLMIGDNIENNVFAEIFNNSSVTMEFPLNTKILGKIYVKSFSKNEVKRGRDVTFIFVTTSAIPTNIKPLNRSATVTVGRKQGVGFTGVFPEFGEIKIEKDINTQYNFKNGYAEYIGDGVIMGVTPGIDTLTVTFNGIESEPVKLVVVEDNSINSIDEEETEAFSISLQAFPNPTSDFIIAKSFSPKLSNAEFFLTDAIGRQISKTIVPFNSGENLTKISMNNLPSGLYFLSLKNEERIEIIKVIKQ